MTWAAGEQIAQEVWLSNTERLTTHTPLCHDLLLSERKGAREALGCSWIQQVSNVLQQDQHARIPTVVTTLAVNPAVPLSPVSKAVRDAYVKAFVCSPKDVFRSQPPNPVFNPNNSACYQISMFWAVLALHPAIVKLQLCRDAEDVGEEVTTPPSYFDAHKGVTPPLAQEAGAAVADGSGDGANVTSYDLAVAALGAIQALAERGSGGAALSPVVLGAYPALKWDEKDVRYSVQLARWVACSELVRSFRHSWWTPGEANKFLCDLIHLLAGT